MELKLVSEDHRRKIYEFGNGGTWKVAKFLEMKEEGTVGNHYHKLKDEMFLLVDGAGSFTVDGHTTKTAAPFSILVKRGNHHTFTLSAGAKLICLASEEHDPNDDHHD